MPIGARDDAAQLYARVFPLLRLITVTKIIGRARAIKHDELAELCLVLQHVAQSRAQGRNTRSHRHEDEVFALVLAKRETMTDDIDKLYAVSFFHLVDSA